MGCTPVLRIHESGNLELEVEWRQLSLLLMTHWGTYAFWPLNYGLCKAGGSVSQSGYTFPGDTAKFPMKYKSELIPEHFGFLVPRDQEVRGRVTTPARVMDPGVLEEAERLLHNGGKEELHVYPRCSAWVPPITPLTHCNCERRNTEIPDRESLIPLMNEGLGPNQVRTKICGRNSWGPGKFRMGSARGRGWMPVVSPGPTAVTGFSPSL